MEADLIINDQLVIPGAELHVSVSRSSGPGGQHVNKTSSRISLRWNIKESNVLDEEMREMLLTKLAGRLVKDSEILIHAETERSQLHNKMHARQRLKDLLIKALHKKKARRKTKPTLASKTKRLNNKIRRSTIKKLRRVVDE